MTTGLENVYKSGNSWQICDNQGTDENSGKCIRPEKLHYLSFSTWS